MNETNQYLQYHNYLLQRSRLGSIYRKNILYPFLSKLLSGKVLDIGCGIGDFLGFRKNTEGIDINPYNVNYCKGLGYKATQVDSFSYPFEEHTFDGIVLDNVLEHIKNPFPLLDEVKRILKKDGVFIIGVPGPKGFKHDPDHIHYYDKKKLSLLMNKNGFKSIGYQYKPVNLYLLGKFLTQQCLYITFIRST